jgi:hypothetical protein
MIISYLFLFLKLVIYIFKIICTIALQKKFYHGGCMHYSPIIFPTLLNASWVQVDLGQLAKKDYPLDGNKNMLLDSVTCDNWVKKIANQHGADYTWGGHFEDRKHLWHGYYKNAKRVTHLGVDYNVPAGTIVSTPRDCEVVHSWADISNHNGWGGRVILKLDTPWKGAKYLMYGHLAHDSLPTEGAIFKAFEVIGKTGVATENGGWFPHLHVQCITEEFFNQFKDNLESLDGYYNLDGTPYELAPDPTFLVGENIE